VLLSFSGACLLMLAPPAAWLGHENAGAKAHTLTAASFVPLNSQKAPQTGSLVERVGDTGFLQLYAESFNGMPLKEKTLAYWLSMAAIAINPIVYDQNSIYGLRENPVPIHRSRRSTAFSVRPTIHPLVPGGRTAALIAPRTERANVRLALSSNAKGSRSWLATTTI